MSFVHNDELSPEPDTHGIPSHPINSTDLVLPYGDQHGMSAYPQDNSGDVLPAADRHDGVMPMHPGTPKPGSFK